MTSSKDYWEKREQERMDLVDEITDDEINRVIKDVNAAYAEVQDKITNIYVNVEGELIHEIGHALEWKHNIYTDSKFLKVLSAGLENVSCYDIYYDESTFRIAMHRIPKQKKFISDMQTIVYETDVLGNPMFNLDSSINVKALQEYFSEGVRCF